MVIDKLRKSQVKYLTFWRDKLLDDINGLSSNGFISSLNKMDSDMIMEIEKEIMHLDNERDNDYYKKLPEFNDLIVLKHNRNFISRTGHYMNSPILEVSCFNGWIAKALDISPDKYVGVDPNSRHFNDAYLFVESVAELIPFQDSSFQTVISKDSLDHYIDLGKSINEIERVLIPGGSFILAVQIVNYIEHLKNIFRLSRKTLKERKKGFIDGLTQWKKGRKIDEQHVHHFSPKDIVNLVCSNKFTYVNSYYYKYSAKVFIFIRND